MNDWEIGKFIKFIVAIQLFMLGLIGFATIGFNIPVLRQIVGFIYLTFIPGLLILRILRLHKLGNIETLLYTVGLSLATLMFTGLFMNTIYPLFGISKPISITPLIVTISAVVLVLCVVCYFRDKNFSYPRNYINIKDVLSIPALLLCLVPFLSIFGTFLVNFHQNNIILMFLIIVLAIIVVLIAFDKFIPKNLYPFAVFVIAISLLYHHSLISMYLRGWDIHLEYQLSNLVMINSHWDPTIAHNTNAMLSLVMLTPVYSNICDMSIIWIFKIIYPLLFSLVPLGLYRVFQKQTGDKIAFLSCFFFVSFITFHTAMLALARQQIAELFLVLLILLLIDKDMDKMKRSVLFIVFGISLVVSHYGLSYIYMFSLISALLILVSDEKLGLQTLMSNFYSKFSRKSEKPAGNPISSKIKDRTISLTFVLLFIIFALTWYMYVSSSSTFNAIVYIGDNIASNIFTDFLNPETAQGADIILSKTVSPLHEVFKYLQIITQIFIVVGVTTLLLKRSEMKFGNEYAAFSYVNLGICFAAIAVPFLASSLNTTRLYQVTLIFLAPFCVIGWMTVSKFINNTVGVSWTSRGVKSSLKGLSVFFAIFLLFNTGFVFEVTKDYPCSISLSPYIDSTGYNEKEALGAKWLSDHTDSDSEVYGDAYALVLADWFHLEKIYRGIYTFPLEIKQMRKNAYVYLRSWNTEKREIACVLKWGKMENVNFEDIPEFVNMISSKNKIYDNAGSQIFAPQRR